MITGKPDILTILENEGIELKQKGKHFWSLCPFHSEGYPSFIVDPERQTFYCFGCGAGGDVISFIMKFKSLDFKSALAYLGINGKSYKPNPQELRKRQLIQQFKQWCNNYHNDLCQLIRTLQKAKVKIKTVEDAEKLAELYHLEPLWLHRTEILQGNDESAKLELYRGVIHEN